MDIKGNRNRLQAVVPVQDFQRQNYRQSWTDYAPKESEVQQRQITIQYGSHLMTFS